MGEHFPRSGHSCQGSRPLEILKIIHLNSLTKIVIVVSEKVKGLSSILVGEYFPGFSHSCQGNHPLEILKTIHINSLTKILIVLSEKVKG